MRLFWEDRPFWKGNFHCHSTRSDGRHSPEEVAKIYQAQGHDFLVITDHRKLSEQAHFMDAMLMLPGMEMDFMLPAEALHIVGFGMSEEFMSSKGWLIGPQQCIDAMRRYGGRAIVAHPAWSLNTPDTLNGLRNATAAEIYNTFSGTPWNGARADSSGILDVAAAHGKLYNYVASDDSHTYTGEAGYSYTMVQAEELSQQSLIDAMDAGRFYCTQGPRFEQITVEDGVVSVQCSPVEMVVFYSNLVWSQGRCLSGKDIRNASYSIAGGGAETFVRVQLVDHEGKSAWSNPIAL
ncbi:MAG: CehA/McbA family metallohydrolase [Eubacteriales bacterium]|nr:CehA/McbA family metallohydrolase [Eubacteriales bacterium]